jgi:hypothetical protein
MSAGDQHDAGNTTDRLQIIDLLNRYSNTVTTGTLDGDEELFVPEAVIEIGSPYDIRVEGRAAIRTWRRDASAGLELLVHTTYSPEIQFVGTDRAEVTSQTREMARSASRADTADQAGIIMNVVIYSVYHDQRGKSGGNWRFARRTARPVYLERGSLSGEAFASSTFLPLT